MKFRNSLYALAIAGACSVSVSAQTALTFDFLEVGSDVQVTVTGNVTASLWTLSGTETNNGNFESGSSFFVFNGTNPNRRAYEPASGVTITGPSSWGSGPYRSGTGTATSSTGSVGFNYTGAGLQGLLYVPTGSFTLGTSSLANTITLTGRSFSNLGITTGNSYTWSIQGGGITDTITFNVGPASPVPEASGSVAGLGLAVAGLYQLGRRRQKTVTQ